MNTNIPSGFCCSVLLNSNPSYGKFIQVYTFYYLIHSYWAHPLKNFIQRLQILLLGRLFAITLKLVLIQFQSIRREKILNKTKQAQCHKVYRVHLLKENLIFSFIKGLSGQKDGSSEKQSITNFCPMDLHDKDNITFA